MLVYVVLLCLFLAALWSPAGKGLTSWLSCMLCFLVFCHFPKCVLVHTRIKGVVGAVKLIKPSSKIFFTNHPKGVLLLWIIHVIPVFCLLCFCAILFIDAL